MTVVDFGQGQACIRPTTALRLAPVVLLAFGVICAVATWGELTTGDSWHPVGLLGAVCGIGAGVQLTFRIGLPSSTYIDLAGGFIFPDARRSRYPLPSSAIQIKDVAAIQVVSGGLEHDPFLELNLVLREPAGNRIGLLAHMNRDAFQEDVATLASLLKVPILGGEWRPEARPGRSTSK